MTVQLHTTRLRKKYWQQQGMSHKGLVCTQICTSPDRCLARYRKSLQTAWWTRMWTSRLLSIKFWYMWKGPWRLDCLKVIVSPFSVSAAKGHACKALQLLAQMCEWDCLRCYNYGDYNDIFGDTVWNCWLTCISCVSNCDVVGATVVQHVVVDWVWALVSMHCATYVHYQYSDHPISRETLDK